MSLGEVCWSVFLAGLPFAHFLDKRVDFWHGQNAWADAWVGVLFLLSLTQIAAPAKNRPLQAWGIWVWLSTCWLWQQTVAGGKFYPMPLLMALAHAMTVIFFYQAATRFWASPEILERILRWVARAGAVVVAYSFLQMANLDQFFRNLDNPVNPDLVVGTIGNPTHLAAGLAFLLPILLLQTGWWWHVVTAANVGLLAYLSLQQQAMGGCLAAITGGLVWTWHRSRRSFWGLLLATAGLGGYFVLHRSFLNPHGRLTAWAYYWELLHKRPITGYGVGFVMQLSRQITEGPMANWRHCHNEYLQVWVEQGVVGLGLLLWALGDAVKTFWQMEKTPLVVCLGAIGAAFLANAAINFPAHLWQLASFGLIAYSGLYALKDA